MTNLTRRAIPILACFLVAATCNYALAVDSGRITDVRVSSDLKQVLIRGDGPLGKHSAFVINQPYRLVMDFDSAGLGELPAKIRIDKGPIGEIRLGKVNSRSRVVLDFGSNPVPPYKVLHQGNFMVITLGEGVAPIPRGGVAIKPLHVASKPSSNVKAANSAKVPARSESPSGMSITTSGVKDNLIFMELADRNDPKRVYRVAIDFDVKANVIRHATLSDHAGNIQRFELAPRDSATRDEDKPKAAAGPRREVTSADLGATDKPKYHWGLPSVERKEAQEQRVSSGSPFHFDDFTLRPRVSAR